MIASMQIQKIEEAVAAITARSPVKPQVGLVLGSGLGALADEVQNGTVLPFADIPGFPEPSVQGHSGRLVLGLWQDVPVVFLQGRVHYYEGLAMQDVVFPTRVLCSLGIGTLVLTNAAGGVNPSFQVGDLMAIHDHINLMGDNPLRGPNIEALGVRFPDMTEAYDKECLAVLQGAAEKSGVTLRGGVYAAFSGPTYETPAEVRMARTLGADAVGMSTVPECIVARHMGVRVAGISCITNLAAGISPHKLSHSEVMDASNENAAKTARLLQAAIVDLAAIKGS